MHIWVARHPSPLLPDFIDDEARALLAKEERFIPRILRDEGIKNLHQLLDELKRPQAPAHAIVVAIPGGESGADLYRDIIRKALDLRAVPFVAYVNAPSPDDHARLLDSGFSAVVSSEDGDGALSAVLRGLSITPSQRGRFISNGPLVIDTVEKTAHYDGRALSFTRSTEFLILLSLMRNLDRPVPHSHMPHSTMGDVFTGGSLKVQISNLRKSLRARQPGLDKLIVLDQRSSAKWEVEPAYRMIPYETIRAELGQPPATVPNPAPKGSPYRDCFAEAAAALTEFSAAAEPQPPEVPQNQAVLSVCDLAEGVAQLNDRSAASVRAFMDDRLGKDWLTVPAQRQIGFEVLYEANTPRQECSAVVGDAYQFMLAQFFNERRAKEAALMQKWMSARAVPAASDADGLDQKLADYVIEKGLAAPLGQGDPPPAQRSESERAILVETVAQKIHNSYGLSRTRHLNKASAKAIADFIDEWLGTDWRAMPEGPDPIGTGDRSIVLDAIYYGAETQDLHYSLPIKLLGLSETQAYDAVQRLHELVENIWQRDFADSLTHPATGRVPKAPQRLTNKHYLTEVAAARHNGGSALAQSPSP
jgi:DNA-binding response OmpR family regulator